jgi:hypothetical protein
MKTQMQFVLCSLIAALTITVVVAGHCKCDHIDTPPPGPPGCVIQGMPTCVTTEDTVQCRATDTTTLTMVCAGQPDVTLDNIMDCVTDDGSGCDSSVRQQGRR